jgi:Ycf66 protein N-terminus
MLAYILAVLVGTGSVGLYTAAFFFPEIHRKHDFIWSGVGVFYALTLWIYGREVVGGVLVGQIASVALLGWSVWQTLKLRRQLVPFGQQASTAMPTQIKERLGFNRSADPRTTKSPATAQPSVTAPKPVATTSAPPPLQQPRMPVAPAPIEPVLSSVAITPPIPAASVRSPAPIDSSPKSTPIVRSAQSSQSIPVEQKVVPVKSTATPDRVISLSSVPDLTNTVEEQAWIELSIKPTADKPLGNAVKPPAPQARISPAIDQSKVTQSVQPTTTNPALPITKAVSQPTEVIQTTASSGNNDDDWSSELEKILEIKSTPSQE